MCLTQEGRFHGNIQKKQTVLSDLLQLCFPTVGISSPCDTNPCFNGGVCVENFDEWTYHCICSEHLTNENCQDGKSYLNEIIIT